MGILIKLNNLKVNDSVLPNLDVSNDDLIIANLPKLTFWLQAGAQYRQGHKIKERINGYTIAPTQTDKITVTDGTFENGEAALILDNAGVYPYLFDQDFEINKSSWTIAFVVHRSRNDPGNAIIMGGVKTATDTDVLPYIGWGGTNQLNLYQGQSTPRISSNDSSGYYDKTILAIISFDITKGLTMRINGAEVATNTSDKRAITDGHFRFFASTGKTIGINDTSFAGKIGCIMTFDTDLSLPINQKSLNKLEKVLMRKYSIS